MSRASGAHLRRETGSRFVETGYNVSVTKGPGGIWPCSQERPLSCIRKAPRFCCWMHVATRTNPVGFWHPHQTGRDCMAFVRMDVLEAWGVAP